MQWECNEDNKDNQNRCAVSGNVNFLVQIKEAMLRELINKYDYAGAQILADAMIEALNNTFIELLDAAVKRDRLSYKKANAILKKYGFSLMEEDIPNYSDYYDIAEFFLFVNLKKCKGEYSDFLRAITPLLVNVFKRILKDNFNFDINDYLKIEKKTKKWDIEKLKDAPKIKKILDDRYKPMKSQPVSSDHLVTILVDLLKDNDKIELCKTLRKIEDRARNLAAHEIVTVNDSWIYSKTGFYTEQINDKIFSTVKLTKINVTDDFLNSYDRMNNLLLEKWRFE